MPTFATPQPISLSAEVGVGHVQIVASERADTVVEVHPTDASKKGDVEAAERTRVDLADGRLTVRSQRIWRAIGPGRGGESVDIRVELPAGSHVRVKAGVAGVHCTGPLGEAHLGTGVGDVHLERATSAEVRTGVGDIDVARVTGRTELRTGSGTIEAATLEGPTTIRNANGDTWVSRATGDLRVSAANGTIVVDQAHGTVGAKSSCGDVRIGDVSSGTVTAQSGFGDIGIGVRDRVPAWLDLDTKFGQVDSELNAAGPPAAGENSVQVRARTSFGDITIHRTGAAAAVGLEA